MRFVETDDNRAPVGGTPMVLTTSDGIMLRAALWQPEGISRGTVCLCTGRAEFIEKYFEVIGELLSRGLSVVAFDWRGQGLSQRPLRNRRKGHVDDFSSYACDLAAIHDQVLAPSCPKPWFGLGHSMGAAVLLAQAHAGRSPFARLVVDAPMIDLHGLGMPRAARGLAAVLDAVGLGGGFIPIRHNDRPLLAKSFAGNRLTSDARRYARNAAILTAAPELALGDPTIGWVNAAFRLMRDFKDSDYPRRTNVPILVFNAGSDRIVAPRAVEGFASRLKAGRLITIAQARHELLMERDVLRAQFWAAFDAFIPGTPVSWDTSRAIAL